MTHLEIARKQITFEIFHKPGTSRDLLIPDILSRLVTDEQADQIASKMERPILRLYKGGMSPIMLEWFKIENPKSQDFEGEGTDGGEREDGKEMESRKNNELRLKLKRLAKEVDKEKLDGLGGMTGCRYVGKSEVEYLD